MRLSLGGQSGFRRLCAAALGEGIEAAPDWPHAERRQLRTCSAGTLRCPTGRRMHDAHAQSAASTPASSADSLPTSSASASPHAPTDTSHHPASRCECLRCGYDLSGAAAAWNHAESTSCPMRGTCSECGLEFAWGDVFSPTLGPARGYFENAEGLGLVSALRTWLWTLWPPLFWSYVGMRATRSPWRMLLWLGLVLVLQQGVFAALVLALRAFTRRAASPLPSGVGKSGSPSIQWLWNDLISPILCNRFEWSSLSTRLTAPTIRVRPGWQAWETVFIPTCVALLVVPVMFGAIPDSRRAGRLRRVHVVRATVCSLSLVASLGALRLPDALTGWLVDGPRVGHGASSTVPRGVVFAYLAEHQIAFAAGVLCWVLFWWWSAIRFGFKLRHGTIVWFAVSLPAIIAWAIWASSFSEPFGDWLDKALNGLLRLFG